MACGISRVYSFGPTFRAESHSHTNRHLAEFWMVEPELAFSNLEIIMNLAENLIKYIIQQIIHNCYDDLTFLEKWEEQKIQQQLLIERLEKFTKLHFERITYYEAINILKKSNKSFQFPIEYGNIYIFLFFDNKIKGNDIQREHEQYLCENYFKNKPLFIINWPKEIKPFYMRINEDNRTVAAIDLIFPEIGELIGGSEREERYHLLLQNMKEHGLLKKNQSNEEEIKEEYKWYLDLRKYGTVPHAGFGLGFERLIRLLTGVKHIKDTIPVPRYKGFCKF